MNMQTNEAKIIIYNKLIRDNIPEIIAKSGKACEFTSVSGDEFIELLNEKLHEEVHEYLLSGSIEELADIIEIIYSILDSKQLSLEDLEIIRIDKLKTHGGFARKLLLKAVIE